MNLATIVAGYGTISTKISVYTTRESALTANYLKKLNQQQGSFSLKL
jgi:hypothetical protein